VRRCHRARGLGVRAEEVRAWYNAGSVAVPFRFRPHHHRAGLFGAVLASEMDTNVYWLSESRKATAW